MSSSTRLHRVNGRPSNAVNRDRESHGKWNASYLSSRSTLEVCHSFSSVPGSGIGVPLERVAGFTSSDRKTAATPSKALK